MPCLELEGAPFLGDERWANERVVLVSSEQVLCHHHELPGRRHDSDLSTAPIPKPVVECAQRTGDFHRCPRPFDERRASMPLPSFTDAPVSDGP